MARYLGIEVTESQVKGVVLRASYRKLQIEAVDRVARAAGPEGLAAAVGEIARRAGKGVDAVYAALPGQEVSLRLLELPKAVLKRGGRVIATELEGSLPFELDGATIDAQVIRSGAQVELLAAAVRTERVRSFLETLRGAGAEPREVGVGPIALGELAAAVPELAARGPVLLVHAYETFADLAVLAGGVVQMARTLADQTTPETRARGVRQTLGAYLLGGGEAPTVAYLFGEWSSHYLDVVADAAGLPAEAVVPRLPLGGIELGPTTTAADVEMAPLALALALRGMGRAGRIDLRKGELSPSRGTQVLRDRAWLLAACFGAVVASWGFATYMRYTAVARDRDVLRAALGRVTLDTFGRRVTDPRRARDLVRSGGVEIEQDPLPQVDAFDVIGTLSARIPASVRHDITQLDIQDEHVQIQGLVDSLQNRDQIVDVLGQWPCFQNIQRGRAQRNPGDDRQQYALDIELRCPDPHAPPPAAGAAGRDAGAGGAPTAVVVPGATGATGASAVPAGIVAPGSAVVPTAVPVPGAGGAPPGPSGGFAPAPMVLPGGMAPPGPAVPVGVGSSTGAARPTAGGSNGSR